MNSLRAAAGRYLSRLGGGCVGRVMNRLGGDPLPGRREVCLLAMIAVVAVITPAGAMSKPPSPKEFVGGTVVYHPDRFNGWAIFTVQRLDSGALSIYANPAHVYQDATLLGAYTGGTPVEIRVLEVFTDQLTPEQRASARGFKDPNRMWRYARLEYEASTRLTQVQVYSFTPNAFLVVLTTQGAGAKGAEQ